MRLNFSGVGEEEIREGIRRIGEVVSEQVRLYGTLTGQRPGRSRAVREERSAEQPQSELARVLRLPRKHAG
jgi:2-aminoadipate transaminase